MRLAVLCLLLSGCATNAYHGLATVQIHTNTLNTKQPCSTDPSVVRLADVAAALYLRAAADAGLVDYLEAAERVRDHRPYVCLVADWEPCRIGSVCARGSEGMDCTDKAGCAGSSWAWAVDGRTLVHELGHALALLWGVRQSPDHSGTWAGVEASVADGLRRAGVL